MTPGRLRVAFLAVMTGLLLHNLARVVENQRALPCGERLCAKPRDLEQLAAQSPPKVASVTGIFYFLGRRLAGATLTVPSWMERYRWELEHISRMRVEVTMGSLLVDPGHIAALREAGSSRRSFMRRGGSEARWLFQDLYLLVEDGTDAYVLAEEGPTWGSLFVIPAARYEEVRAR